MFWTNGSYIMQAKLSDGSSVSALIKNNIVKPGKSIKIKCIL